MVEARSAAIFRRTVGRNGSNHMGCIDVEIGNPEALDPVHFCGRPPNREMLVKSESAIIRAYNLNKCCPIITTVSQYLRRMVICQTFIRSCCLPLAGRNSRLRPEQIGQRVSQRAILMSVQCCFNDVQPRRGFGLSVLKDFGV